MATVLMTLECPGLDEAKELASVLDYWWMLQGKSAYSTSKLTSIQIVDGSDLYTKNLNSERSG